MKKFKLFLAEGGNVQVGDISAQAVDLSKIERKKFIQQLVKGLLELNKQFEKEYGMKIWEKESFVTSGKVFSGSSQHFINLDIPDEEFSKYKPTVGDIDVQVSESIEKLLHEFFKKNKKFGDLTYVGQSQSAVGQISALFSFNGHNLQIDFEFVDIGDDGMPTEWSHFSRSSDWNDIKEGIKGVFHKYIIGCLDRSFTATVKVKKGKKNPKIEEKEVHFFAFSVKNGLRPKYSKGDDDVWEEITAKNGKYTKDIKEIFEFLFKKKPSEADIKNFNSFTGIVQLVKKYFKSEQQKKIISAFVDFIWGRGAQKLYKGDPAQDMKVKLAAVKYIEKELKTDIQKQYSTLINTYYERY